jgi:hypothetical protein
MKHVLRITLIVVVIGLIAFAVGQYENQFTLKMESTSGAKLLASHHHFSAIQGNHDYRIFNAFTAGNPRPEGVVWISEGVTVFFQDKTALWSGQGCGIFLKTNSKGNLIGMGLVDEDGNFERMQSFSPIAIDSGQIYRLVDFKHPMGANCLFEKSNEMIRFAAWGMPISQESTF